MSLGFEQGNARGWFCFKPSDQRLMRVTNERLRNERRAAIISIGTQYTKGASSFPKSRNYRKSNLRVAILSSIFNASAESHIDTIQT